MRPSTRRHATRRHHEGGAPRTHARTHDVLPTAGGEAEDEDDPLQMMLNTKKKREQTDEDNPHPSPSPNPNPHPHPHPHPNPNPGEQTDEEMRVRVDEDVERMMENGVTINPSASLVKTRRLGGGRVGRPWRTHGARRPRALVRRPPRAWEQSGPGPALHPWSLCEQPPNTPDPPELRPSRLLRARYGKATG